MQAQRGSGGITAAVPVPATTTASEMAAAAEVAAAVETLQAPPTRAERLERMGQALATAASAIWPASAGEPVTEPGAVPTAGPQLDLAQACATLGVAPDVLRRVLEAFADLLPEAAGGNGLAPETVERLRLVLGWRNAGLSEGQIRERLSGAVAGVAAAPAEERLLAEVGRLHTELQRGEARRTEDRDRLLLALMRTNQELQHLRFELAAAGSRRERRRGIWHWLFG